MSSSATLAETGHVAKGWKHRLERLEFKIAVFSTTLWAIISMATRYCATSVVRVSPEYAHIRGYVQAYMFTSVITQVLFIALVWMSIRPGASDLGPEVMKRYPRIPLPLRPFLALWWLIQFLEAVFLSLIIDGVIYDPQGNLPAGLWIVRYFLGYVIIYASNTYLLLAIGTITHRESVWGLMWRKRFLIDVFLTSLSIFTGLFNLM